jgi:hypothetical protein
MIIQNDKKYKMVFGGDKWPSFIEEENIKWEKK